MVAAIIAALFLLALLVLNAAFFGIFTMVPALYRWRRNGKVHSYWIYVRDAVRTVDRSTLESTLFGEGGYSIEEAGRVARGIYPPLIH